MIPGQLIASGQLTDPGVNFASVHGLTPVKSVQSTLRHLLTTSVPRAMFTHFLVEHELSQYYLY